MRAIARDRLIAVARDPHRLRSALRNDEFTPYFQPVLDLTSGRVVGYEALVRWAHPSFGVLTPDRFLLAFETSELILSLDARMLDLSLQALSRLQRRPAAAGSHMAVNVSGRELTRPGLAARVTAALIATDERARSLLHNVTRAATDLGLHVVAEGLEDEQTTRIAASCGIQFGQGYVLGRPAAEADLLVSAGTAIPALTSAHP